MKIDIRNIYNIIFFYVVKSDLIVIVPVAEPVGGRQSVCGFVYKLSKEILILVLKQLSTCMMKGEGLVYTTTIVIETLFPVPLPDNYGFCMGMPIWKP